MSNDGRIQSSEHPTHVGRLPVRAPDKLWGGPATGDPCAICGVPTVPGSVELELQFTDDADGRMTTYRVHPHCFSIFNLELERLGRAS
jgi:hypothetical protein